MDLGRRPGLPLEAVHEGAVVGEARVHHLDRHPAVETRVQPAVHRGHATAGEQRVDPVPLLKQRPDQADSPFVHDRDGTERGVTPWRSR
jgi:hypothetical protein